MSLKLALFKNLVRCRLRQKNLYRFFTVENFEVLPFYIFQGLLGFFMYILGKRKATQKSFKIH